MLGLTIRHESLGPMTDASLKSSRRGAAARRDRETDLSQYLVPPAMLVAAVAMGVASNLHLGAPPEMAVGVGAALFCAMLLCHVLLRAADIADQAEEAAAERRADQVPSPMPTPDRITSDNLPPDLLPNMPTDLPPDLPPDLMAVVPQQAPDVRADARSISPLDADGSARDAEFGRGLGAVVGRNDFEPRQDQDLRADVENGLRNDVPSGPSEVFAGLPSQAPAPARVSGDSGRALPAPSEFAPTDMSKLGSQDATPRYGMAAIAEALPSLPSYSADPAVLQPSPASPSGWLFRPVEMRVPAVEFAAPLTERSLAVAEHVAAQSVLPSEAEAAAVVAAIGALRPTVHDRTAPRAEAGSNEALPANAPSQPLSVEADRIDSILKRLARQIREGTLAHPIEPSFGPFPGSQPEPTAEPTADQIRASRLEVDALPELAASRPDTALESAVDALRSTVEAMRQGMNDPEPALNSISPAPSMAPPTPVEARIAAVADALAAERVDVVLAPILALAGEEARHFEVSVRLRSVEGELLDDRAIASAAGLLPLLDALSVRHAAGFALKLERRGRAGAVFSTIGGQSLESEGFVGDVSGRYAQGIADRMVLSFAQAEMRGLGPAQMAAIGDLADLGFRFALTGVADLDMDFEALRATGFQFVKLDASVFLGGLPCAGAVVPASDICLHFSDLGIEVIVSGIADERLRDNIANCGVSYGQGALFGEPRPIPFAGGGALAA